MAVAFRYKPLQVKACFKLWLSGVIYFGTINRGRGEQAEQAGLRGHLGASVEALRAAARESAEEVN